MLNESRITSDTDRCARRQAECNQSRVPQVARVTACLIDPGEKVSRPLRCLVINFGAAEWARLCRGIDRLSALWAIEDVELFSRPIDAETVFHRLAPRVDGKLQNNDRRNSCESRV